MKQEIKHHVFIKRHVHYLIFKKILMNMNFTHSKCLFNENEACNALRDDYIKIAAHYDAVKRQNLNS